jgi:tRNA uridine 5-carboxymethylaminomethyl modification enzyme
MFTSRAEYRTILRQDNADLRLTEKSFRIGLASQERMNRVIGKRKAIEEIKEILNEIRLEPQEANSFLSGIPSANISQKTKASQLLLRPQITLENMIAAIPKVGDRLNVYSSESIDQAEIQVKYQVYIEKEEEMVKKMNGLEEQVIPNSFNYENISSLSNEARQKFKKIKPQTLGQASRISGVNPSDVQILMVYMGR